MKDLAFVLTPDAVFRVHDALICLAKFNENVGFEADEDKVVLSTLNSSRTSFASISLLRDAFFQSYRYRSNRQSAGQANEVFKCRILAKSLLSIFKGRASDFKDGENSIERCEASVQEHADITACRLVVKMICRHGVKKTYKLTYESTDLIKPRFDSSIVRNRWTISAYVLKTFSEFFGARTENLDMCYDAGRVRFDCFTEKISHQAEVLKQPLHTSVDIDIADFEDYNLEEKRKVGTSVKDFKAIITHAVTLKTSITAMYSHSGRPMQITYSESGLQCEFTLMTSGDPRNASVTPAPTVSRASVSQARPPPTDMPPSLRRNAADTRQEPASQHPHRPSPPAPRASINEESLFVTDEDEEEQAWGEGNLVEDEGELKWDSTRMNVVDNAASRNDRSMGLKRKLEDDAEGDEMRIAPTQRLSQIKGLFD